MNARISDYLNSRQLPTGRRLFALKALLNEANRLGSAELAAKCQRAIDTDRQTQRVERAWRQQKSAPGKSRGDAVDLDRQIDALWGAMHSVVRGQMVGDDPLSHKAATFMHEVFPDGLAGLVKRSFEEQLAEQESLLERFAPGTGDLAGHIDALGLRRHVDQLNPLVDAFAHELQLQNNPTTWGDVTQARSAGLNAFASALFLVLCTWDEDSPQHAAQRAACLAEYHRQDALVAEALRRRRPVVDIDPDTGEELAEDQAQPAESAP